MIGCRGPQAELFDVGNVFALELDAGSFFAQLAVAAPRLFCDADFAAFYHERLGRPSVPPSQLALMVLMQEYTHCSDQEAVECSGYDLRWCAVLRRPAGEPLCAKSTLQEFKAHLVLHDGARTLFRKSIEEARRSGLLKRGSALRLNLDTKPVVGHGAVQDTFNLLATGVRQLAQVLAEEAGEAVKDWAAAQGLARYVEGSVKGSVDIDWSDEQARNEVLAGITADVRKVLDLATACLGSGGMEEGRQRKLREKASLLARLVLQDVAEGVDAQGKAQAEVKQGTARNRIPSATDPEQRHGHKSKSKRFTGYKAAVAVDEESQIFTDVDVIPGNASDAEGALAQVERSEENTGEKVEQTTTDCAYGDRKTRQEFAEAGRDLAARVAKDGSNGGRFPKSRFGIDLEKNTVTCPGGQTTDAFAALGNGGKVFSFGARCAGCPLREQCTKGAHGRTVGVHPQEAERAKAREYQESPEGRARFRKRVVVEHGLARLSRLGIGKAKYRGKQKTRFQVMMAATVANLRWTWNWAQGKEGEGSGGPEGRNGAGSDAPGSLHGLPGALLRPIRAFWGLVGRHLRRARRPAVVAWLGA